MNRLFRSCIALFLLLFLSSWGFHAHRVINRMAVFTLPVEVSVFFKDYVDYISEHAVDADKRCYVDTAESPRHFIDVDNYGTSPFDTIPVHWSAAVEKLSERRLLTNGIIPWQINRSYHALTRAMADKNLDQILRHAADLGHYLADAHVPLHTTANYNGQLTGQIGIHAFWESRLPEMFSSTYNFFVGRAHYVESPLDEGWRIIKESFALVDSVLSIERELNELFREDAKYAYITRNNILVRTYSDQYATAYHDALQTMVERRMRASVRAIGNFWYSAWVDAGQPDLRPLTKHQVVLDSIPSPAAGQKIIGREEWH